MIKDQVITVTNKAQLLVAFGCALDFEGTTRITLERKDSRTFYNLRPSADSWFSMEIFNKFIRRARAKIKRIPAECFR